MLPLTKLRKYIYKRPLCYTYINNRVMGYARDGPTTILKFIMLSLRIGNTTHCLIIYSDNNCTYIVFQGVVRILFISKLEKNKIRIILNENYYKYKYTESNRLKRSLDRSNEYFYETNLPNFTQDYTKYRKKHF